VQLQHRFTVPAAVDTTWDTFLDLAEVAACFPGAIVTSVEGDRFEGTCKVKLGPIALVYAGSGQVVSRDDQAHRAVIEATGKDKRGNGTAGAKVTVVLAANGGGGTAVDVTTDLNVTGKPAQFGRGVMQDVSDKLLGQFVACLEQRFAEQPAAVTESSAAPEEAESVPVPAAPSSVASASSRLSVKAAMAAAGSEAAPSTSSQPAAAATATAESPTLPVDAPTVSEPPRPSARPSNVDKPAFVRVGAGGSDDALDLGSTVLPILIRTYAPYALAGAVGFVLGVIVARRRT
jgi:carbon monoxide dehydrogenase subunit G